MTIQLRKVHNVNISSAKFVLHINIFVACHRSNRIAIN